MLFRSGPQGTIYATGTIVAGYSDLRLKDVLNVVDNSLERIDNIRGIYYEQNETARKLGFNDTERKVGLIAQEVKAVLPEVVVPAPFDVNKYNESISGENYLTIMYERVVPLLIQALKEQKGQIDYIKNKL